jgi:hypothetical protein
MEAILMELYLDQHVRFNLHMPYSLCLALSFRSGTPREGWTKEFIINPRELINQYGTETLTTIFDLEDHTPKTLVTTKEVISSVEKKESTPYQI